MTTDYPRDMLGYGRSTPDPQWPGGANVCVQFVVNYEEGGENNILHGDAASEAFLSEIVGAAQWPGQRHWNMESIYEYGARAGFWRLWRMFTKRNMPVTVYGVTSALARSPDQLKAMQEADWEIASHGLKWVEHKDMPIEEERRQIAESIRLHTELVGERPLGWYTGRCSMNTQDLVMEEGGFLYSSDTYADDLVVRRIRNLSVVSRAFLADEQKYAVRIALNPVALAARNLSPEDVRIAVQRASINRPKGKLLGGELAATIESNDQLYDAGSFREVVVAHRNDGLVRLGDVARVTDGVEDDRNAGWYNGHPAIILGVQKRNGANTVAVVDSIRASLERMRASLPAAVKLDIVTDRAEVIRASLHDVARTLAVTIGMVVLVIFLFLRRFWATVIPSITIPLSLLGTLIAMVLLGFTLDNLSLMALTISVGFVVDDAIVVIENIVRHLDNGKTPVEAAVQGGGRSSLPSFRLPSRWWRYLSRCFSWRAS